MIAHLFTKSKSYAKVGVDEKRDITCHLFKFEKIFQEVVKTGDFIPT